MTLEGKVAVVTGGGSGIGAASAQGLARAGAAVVVADVDDDRAAEVARRIEAAGGTARSVRTDVTDPAQCEALVAATVESFGGLHVLHNNAGIALVGQDGPTARMQPEAWDRVIATNLSSVYYCSHYAIAVMAVGGGGAIVNTASSMATLPLGGMDAYAASKGGVAILTRSMSASCGPLGIRVNAICPGYVDTPMNSVIWGAEPVKRGFEIGHATGLQDPEEIAEVVLFLASDASRSLTGAVITCDRGWTAFKRPDLLAGTEV